MRIGECPLDTPGDSRGGATLQSDGIGEGGVFSLKNLNITVNKVKQLGDI